MQGKWTSTFPPICTWGGQGCPENTAGADTGDSQDPALEVAVLS